MLLSNSFSLYENKKALIMNYLVCFRVREEYMYMLAFFTQQGSCWLYIPVVGPPCPLAMLAVIVQSSALQSTFFQS